MFKSGSKLLGSLYLCSFCKSYSAQPDGRSTPVIVPMGFLQWGNYSGSCSYGWFTRARYRREAGSGGYHSAHCTHGSLTGGTSHSSTEKLLCLILSETFVTVMDKIAYHHGKHVGFTCGVKAATGTGCSFTARVG